jgi:hypothetical protein
MAESQRTLEDVIEIIKSLPSTNPLCLGRKIGDIYTSEAIEDIVFRTLEYAAIGSPADQQNEINERL